MTIATLNIENQVYVELHIADTPMLSTPNLIDEIFIRDGFGIGVPTLELFLYDQRGTLVDELALMEGKKLSIVIGKYGGDITRRDFRVFGFNSVASHIGPRLRIVCLIDVPKFSAQVLSKAYSGTSANVLQTMASECGLIYSGPHSGTSDNMKWLRVAQTLNSFTEDVATHGYMSEQSCMYRLLLSDYTLLYKDLFYQLNDTTETATFLFNTPSETLDVTGQKLLVRELRASSKGGVFSHWFNYGQYQFEHNLSGNQVLTDGITPPISTGIPVNLEVKADIKTSRYDYVGFDSGGGDTPGSNYHQYYNKAKYQNLRFYGLFNESINVLVEEYTDTRVFDSIFLHYTDLKDLTFVSNNRFTGKYLVGNKIIAIKNGSKYYEIFDLYRPSVGNANPA